MRSVVLALLVTLTPAFAEESPAVPEPEGWSLMERGAKLLLEGFLTEVEPTLDEMGRALSEIEPTLRSMEPVLRDLITMLGDIRFYHAPEKLPNGDIIIRRKTAPEIELEGLTGPQIEL